MSKPARKDFTAPKTAFYTIQDYWFWAAGKKLQMRPRSFEPRRALPGSMEEKLTKIDRFLIPGPVGSLEAVLEYDANTAPAYSAVVCHPHPLYGGTMHTKIVFRAAKAAALEGLPALRFNFRGVGTSQGEFAHGIGELEDVRAALDAISARYPAVPVFLMGFSFGSAMCLQVGASDQRVAALVGMGLPVQKYDFSYLHSCLKPKLFVEGSEDEFGPRAQVEDLIATVSPPKELHWIEGGDHYCTGRLDEVEEVIRRFIRQTVVDDSKRQQGDPSRSLP